MPSSYRTTRRVQFADTDMAGIVHFPRFFYYMEEVEHEFLRSLGTDVVIPYEEGHISWPRVSAGCDYKAPIRYGDVLDVQLRIARKGRSSITYEFFFWVDQTLVAEGRITAVCCQVRPGRKPQPIAFPEFLEELLVEYQNTSSQNTSSQNTSSQDANSPETLS